MARPPARRNVDFFCAVIIVGLLAGVAGLATTFVLRFVQHLTYHYTFGALLAGVAGKRSGTPRAGADDRWGVGGSRVVDLAQQKASAAAGGDHRAP
ncbi:hypothetical protein WU83_30240 [Mycobacterium nebraskense]|nr:hypothetical protein WU83_30240 [Mycobacterium nebraskense]